MPGDRISTEKITKNEAILYLVGIQRVTITELGDNCVICGTRLRYVKASLDYSCEVSSFDTLVLEVFVDERKIDAYRINFMQRDENLRHGVGYYWDHDHKFYYRYPNRKGVDVQKILDFHEVTG